MSFSYVHVTLRLLFVDTNKSTFGVLTGSQGREHSILQHRIFVNLLHRTREHKWPSLLRVVSPTAGAATVALQSNALKLHSSLNQQDNCRPVRVNGWARSRMHLKPSHPKYRTATTHLNIQAIAAMGFLVCPLFTTGTGTSVYFQHCRYTSAPSTWTTKYVLLPYTHLRELISIDSHFYFILLLPGLPPLIASASCAAFCVAFSPSHSLRSSYRRTMGFFFIW